MKKFNEYNKFNLSDINKEVLERWNMITFLRRVLKCVKARLRSCSSRVRHRPTVCLASTM